MKNGKEIFGLLKVLGTTDPDVEVCRQNLYRNLQDADAMVEINKGIERQREHFDNLGLHIGYVYGDKEIPTNVSRFQSSCVPGARLPHAWIKVSLEKMPLPAIDNSYVHEFSENEVCEKQFSTLDLCGLDTFTLIVDESTAPHFEWVIEELINELPREVAAVLPMKLIVHGADFALQTGPEAQKWAELMNLKKQAILVCPDQHILACLPCNSGPKQLLKVLEGHLGW